MLLLSLFARSYATPQSSECVEVEMSINETTAHCRGSIILTGCLGFCTSSEVNSIYDSLLNEFECCLWPITHEYHKPIRMKPCCDSMLIQNKAIKPLVSIAVAKVVLPMIPNIYCYWSMVIAEGCHKGWARLVCKLKKS